MWLSGRASPQSTEAHRLHSCLENSGNLCHGSFFHVFCVSNVSLLVEQACLVLVSWVKIICLRTVSIYFSKPHCFQGEFDFHSSAVNQICPQLGGTPSSTILYFPIAHNSLCLPPIFCINYCKLWNTLGRSAYSQEPFATIVYAKLGGQTECIMGNWKIENDDNLHFESAVAELLSLEKSSAWSKMVVNLRL